MGDTDPKTKSTRCTAHSKTTGKQCGRSAIPGGTVCRYHGGAAPQVIERARLRLAALVLPAVDYLGRGVRQKKSNSPGVASARDILDRAGLKPVEKHEVTVKSPRNMTADELEQWLAELRADMSGTTIPEATALLEDGESAHNDPPAD